LTQEQCLFMGVHKMAKYFERIIDINTGEETVRNYTAAEIAEAEAATIEAATLTAEAEAKEAARASAMAKLSALGLSADEIAAL
jgi:hypothetical protein